MPVAPRRVRLWLPVVALMAAIFTASSMPSPPTPPGVSDKTLHAGTYGLLALLALRALADGQWRGVTPRALALAWLVAAGYGAFDEWYQSFVPRRRPEWLDAAADAAGAGAALAAAWAWSIIRRFGAAGARRTGRR